MSRETCNSCRFWLLDDSTHRDDRPVEEGDIAFGSCRKNAPVVIGALAALGIPRPVWGREADPNDELHSEQVYRASVQPVTECGDWCGCFEPAPFGGEARS